MAYQKVCTISGCPEPTYGRLTDNKETVRRDLCLSHFHKTLSFYNRDPNHPAVKIVEIWGNKT